VARRADGRPVHLVAAVEHTTGVVRGQVGVDAKSNEISAFVPLLDQIDLTGVAVTPMRCTPRTPTPGTCPPTRGPPRADRQRQPPHSGAGAVHRGIPTRLHLREVNPRKQALETETNLFTHAIRMTAFNTVTALARDIRINTNYARANHEA
jgi:hypothetical protein